MGAWNRNDWFLFTTFLTGSEQYDMEDHYELYLKGNQLEISLFSDVEAALRSAFIVAYPGISHIAIQMMTKLIFSAWIFLQSLGEV